MNVRIIKSDGSLGEKEKFVDVPADLYKLQKSVLSHPSLIGFGRWKNKGQEPYIAMLPTGSGIVFITKELFESIKDWFEQSQKKEAAR
jgi:hypothetical protein